MQRQQKRMKRIQKLRRISQDLQNTVYIASIATIGQSQSPHFNLLLLLLIFLHSLRFHFYWRAITVRGAVLVPSQIDHFYVGIRRFNRFSVGIRRFLLVGLLVGGVGIVVFLVAGLVQELGGSSQRESASFGEGVAQVGVGGEGGGKVGGVDFGTSHLGKVIAELGYVSWIWLVLM